MSGSFAYKRTTQDGKARRGHITTPHGVVQTPAFMPVGTAGTVKALYTDQVRETGADVVLGNVYHLMLRPTAERVARLGGLHKFMRWPHTILTDSGGFQVMSLGALRKLDEKGVTFKSHVDGSKHYLSPERSVEIQGLLGSDIQMQLDECIALPAERKEVTRAMEMSARWAERSKTKFQELKSVARGIDMFDCVMPTRAGRHSLAYTRFGKINLKNARHADDPRPLDEESSCPAARDYSRAYLHHLIRTSEPLGGMLLSWNNIAYYQDLMKGARDAIEAGTYADYMAACSEGWDRGDIAAVET